eukprot:5096196-Lingulodinium_polyedra.AAC.1
MRVPLRQRTADSIASLHNVLQTLHNDVVELTARCRNGSLIARSRTPGTHQFSGTRKECANVQLTNR